MRGHMGSLGWAEPWLHQHKIGLRLRRQANSVILHLSAAFALGDPRPDLRHALLKGDGTRGVCLIGVVSGATSSRSQRSTAASRAASVRRPSRMTSLSVAYSPEATFDLTISAMSMGREMAIASWIGVCLVAKRRCRIELDCAIAWD